MSTTSESRIAAKLGKLSAVANNGRFMQHVLAGLKSAPTELARGYRLLRHFTASGA